jgi:Fe-S-cluster-containing dehydrogenase component
MSKVIYYDIAKCDNCGDCVASCKATHLGRAHIFVQQVHESFLPSTCRQCEHSACVQVCPTGACHRSQDGTVVIASMKCVGCQLCSIACPFGSIWFDTLNKVSRKCDLCREARVDGESPACVQACREKGALRFGELEEMLAVARAEGSPTYMTRSGGTVGGLVSVPENWPQGAHHG